MRLFDASVDNADSRIAYLSAHASCRVGGTMYLMSGHAP